MDATDFDPVGGRAARRIHGYSAGADVVLLGAEESREGALTAVLSEVCTPRQTIVVGGGGAQALRRLAEIAATGAGPLVLADAGLSIALPAVLDLLDVPGDPTATLTGDPVNIEAPRQHWSGLEHASLARLGPDGLVESVSTAGRPVAAPNRILVGLLRVAHRDRAAAAARWRSAADTLDSGAGGAGVDTAGVFDAALLVLIRAGLPVSGSGIGYIDWSRGGFGATGLGRSPWRQRLRSASRLGDGAYSTAVVRPLSRLGTRLALAIGLTPNAITLISIAIGLLAAVLIMTGRPLAWVVAAVLVQLALVVDCMDGEVARFTRRFSTFGAWLDGIGDRLKEYLIFAAVAVVAAGDGQQLGWPLAAAAMVLITARHLEDYAYNDRGAADRVSDLTPRPLDQPDRGGRTRTSLPGRPNRKQRIIFWAKKIVHAPVAERTLIISIGLLTLRPEVVLIASIAVSVVALAWTAGGRFLRALRSPRPHGGAELDQQLDLGVLGRRLAGPVRKRSAARNPQRLDWLLLPLLFLLESALIMVVGWTSLEPAWWPLVFGVLAAVVCRRYQLIYDLRLFAAAGPGPLLGVDGRILLVLIGWLVATVTGPVVLVVVLLAVAVVTLAEAVRGTVVAQAWVTQQT